MEKTLLIIDDEDNMRHMLKSLLHKSCYTICEAANGQDALNLVKDRSYDFILCDVRMPRIDGLQFLKQAKEHLQHSTVIMMSAYGSIDLALEAIKLGAYDYISKPFKTDEVLLTLKKAEEREKLQKENRVLRSEINNITKRDIFSDIIGSSEPLNNVIQQAIKVAQYDTSVLITGESGTGKELIARGIHNHSPRAAQQLITVNCASIPHNLLESEFFGFIKGAFTGADACKIGLLKEADGSTLFLDEIGELPMELQAKLLRILQDGELRPLGSNKTEKIDVRILAATAKDLSMEVEAGKFRQDLFFRLNVVELTVPPLRDRQIDISLLVEHFITKYQIKMKSSVIRASKDTLNLFRRYNWPGNIRELQNVIEHAMIYCEGSEITPEVLPPKLQFSDLPDNNIICSQTFSLKEGKIQMERVLIQKALKETRGNKSQAAGILELSYPSLLAKIKEYDL
ncbi:MAG: two-component system response regulator AtoC [Desulforhopalus sp.]|jgi:two-component system response regulator AtoC